MHISRLPKVLGIIRSKGEQNAVIIDIESFKKFLAKIKIEGLIEEADYLRKYPDVAEAVSGGRIKSATTHYIRAGFYEQREADIVELTETNEAP